MTLAPDAIEPNVYFGDISSSLERKKASARGLRTVEDQSLKTG